MTCDVPECGRPVCAKGKCQRHYRRWLRNDKQDVEPRQLAQLGDDAEAIKFRCTAELKVAAEAAARAKKLALSEWCRRAVAEAVKRASYGVSKETVDLWKKATKNGGTQ